MLVPQVPHVPFIALRPFFIVTSLPLPISLLCLHFTQYPISAILSKHGIVDIKQPAEWFQGPWLIRVVKNTRIIPKITNQVGASFSGS